MGQDAESELLQINTKKFKKLLLLVYMHQKFKNVPTEPFSNVFRQWNAFSMDVSDSPDV